MAKALSGTRTSGVSATAVLLCCGPGEDQRKAALVSWSWLCEVAAAVHGEWASHKEGAESCPRRELGGTPGA